MDQVSPHFYDAASAELYATLGIEGTTYEASFDAAREMLGDLSGKRCLDFGCGTGRSTMLLRSLGAKQAVGVDRNESMVSAAVQSTGVEYLLMREGLVPCPDETFDAALASHVFVEARSESELLTAHAEIARCLKSGGELVSITMNPESLGAQWLTFGYEPRPDVVSGEEVTCVVQTAGGELRIQDVWWSQEDYERIVIESGFRILDRQLPLASGEGWKDETTIAPDVVYRLVKDCP